MVEHIIIIALGLMVLILHNHFTRRIDELEEQLKVEYKINQEIIDMNKELLQIDSSIVNNMIRPLTQELAKLHKQIKPSEDHK